MTALRMRARDIMNEQELIEVRTRSTWKSVFLIAHAWTLILGSIAMVALWPNPLTFVLAVAIIGSRQLGLAILMHDGAHGCLAKGEKLNLFLSQWFCAYPVFAETKAYRRYHLQHHARTQQDDDPDLILSAPFPITRPSYRRKFWRDISGQTGYAQRKAQFLNALGDASWPPARRAAHFWRKLGPQILFNLVLLAGLAVAGIWWAYPLLWLVPLLTWMMVITRIRNIAEHAVVPDSNDPLRNTPHHARRLFRTAVHRALLRQLPSRASFAVLRALLQPAARAQNSLAQPACGADGSAAELRRRAADCDRQTRQRGQARHAGEQRPARPLRRRGR
jgi:fatty acid desaturase